MYTTAQALRRSLRRETKTKSRLGEAEKINGKDTCSGGFTAATTAAGKRGSYESREARPALAAAVAGRAVVVSARRRGVVAEEGAPVRESKFHVGI